MKGFISMRRSGVPQHEVINGLLVTTFNATSVHMLGIDPAKTP